MKKYQLIDMFNFALKFRKKYIGVASEIRGEEAKEYTIDSGAKMAAKMAGYMSEYNDDMVLKSNDGVRITRVAAADTIEAVMELLEGEE